MMQVSSENEAKDVKLKKVVNRGESNRCCANCAHGRHTPQGDAVLCEKKGVKATDSCCRQFKYDPLNRIPSKPLALSEHSPEEFQL